METRLIALSSLVALAACTSVHEPSEVADTSGARFQWVRISAIVITETGAS